MGRSQREKGTRGELEWRDKLREHGFEAIRGRQNRGGPGSPDVICPDLEWIHFEVKRTEKLELWKALWQADTERGRDQIPVVAHRPNGRKWIVVLQADDFLSMLEDTEGNDGE